MIETPENRVPFRGEIYLEDRNYFTEVRKKKDLKVAQLFHELVQAHKTQVEKNVNP